MAIEDVLDGTRVRLRYKDHSVYTTLCRKSGRLHAIQTSVSDADINRDGDALSNIEAVARLSSLVARAYGAEMLVRELQNCSHDKNSLPAIIARAVVEHGGGE